MKKRIPPRTMNTTAPARTSHGHHRPVHARTGGALEYRRPEGRAGVYGFDHCDPNTRSRRPPAPWSVMLLDARRPMSEKLASRNMLVVSLFQGMDDGMTRTRRTVGITAVRSGSQPAHPRGRVRDRAGRPCPRPRRRCRTRRQASRSRGSPPTSGRADTPSRRSPPGRPPESRRRRATRTSSISQIELVVIVVDGHREAAAVTPGRRGVGDEVRRPAARSDRARRSVRPSARCRLRGSRATWSRTAVQLAGPVHQLLGAEDRTETVGVGDGVGVVGHPLDRRATTSISVAPTIPLSSAMLSSTSSSCDSCSGRTLVGVGVHVAHGDTRDGARAARRHGDHERDGDQRRVAARPITATRSRPWPSIVSATRTAQPAASGWRSRRV